MTDICRDCEWMKRDNQMQQRCYSPQLIRVRLAGIPVNFETDPHSEPERRPEMGTGKCGPDYSNYKKREGY